ncbi:MAG TPA: UvrD-helicase domain-containing protein, partial [Gaiellaceae bacterium]|nr:UvrD-helicase domain-containing protein [Gaiellaceae bacterium]
MSTVVEPQAPNPEQAAAIGAAGTVFVSAGAGTGKTTVIVERFLRAVESGVDVGSILVVTFTERAAGELRSRIRARLTQAGRIDLARELDGAWISTIHGFCHRLLRSYPAAAGVDPRFRVLDESQASVLRSESFDAALEEFCSGEHPDRVRLLATYGAGGLRRMLGGVAETLRAAGRPLELGLEQEPDLSGGLARLKAAAGAALAECEEGTAADVARIQLARAMQLVDSAPPVDLLLDLSDIAVKGRGQERFRPYEDARLALEQT